MMMMMKEVKAASLRAEQRERDREHNSVLEGGLGYQRWHNNDDVVDDDQKDKVALHDDDDDDDNDDYDDGVVDDDNEDVVGMGMISMLMILMLMPIE